MKRKYKIIVSDPWDYKNAQGENTIIGEILKIISIRCIIFVSDSRLDFGGVRGNNLILSSRYKESNVAEDLHGLSVNGGLLLEEFDSSYSESDLKNHSKFVIIGRLERY